MVYDKIFNDVKNNILLDYSEFIDDNQKRILERIKIIIDENALNDNYEKMIITLKSRNYDDISAFLIIYHETLHGIFRSVGIMNLFMQNILNVEHKIINKSVLNMIQDILFDYQMKIKYKGSKFNNTWKKLKKDSGTYKALKPIDQKLKKFIIDNKIDSEFIDLYIMQNKAFKCLKEDLIINFSKDK